MNIVILGAGQVGRTAAQNLSSEENDITVVDRDAQLLQNLQERLDLRTVTGHGAHPDVLIEAGIEEADILLAVTNSDETNMVACQIAHLLFHTPTRLARIRSRDYLAHPNLFNARGFAVNYLISPEQLVTTFIHHLIEQPGALQILDFFQGAAQLVACQVQAGSAMAGRVLSHLPAQIPGVETRLVALYRRGQVRIPEGTTVIEPEDEIFFLANSRDIETVIGAFRLSQSPYHKVMIVGGGNVGKQLAERLQGDRQVKIIERDARRCRYLRETLDPGTQVLQGNAGDTELLQTEDIAHTDVFCALTNNDEDNILSATLAKRMGVRKTLALVNSPSYVDLVQGEAIDIVVSPALVIIGNLLTHIRRGDVEAVYSLRRGAAEAIELWVHGDETLSRVVGRPLDRLSLPPHASVGAILRQGRLIFPHHDERLEAEDRLVIFLADKADIPAVERLFHVPLSFV